MIYPGTAKLKIGSDYAFATDQTPFLWIFFLGIKGSEQHWGSDTVLQQTWLYQLASNGDEGFEIDAELEILYTSFKLYESVK